MLNGVATNKSCTYTPIVICRSFFIFQETTPNVINWQDYEGRSALHLAVADGNDAVVNALVLALDGNCCLLYFCCIKHYLIVQFSKVVS